MAESDIIRKSNWAKREDWFSKTNMVQNSLFCENVTFFMGKYTGNKNKTAIIDKL